MKSSNITVSKFCSGVYNVRDGTMLHRGVPANVTVTKYSKADGDSFNGWIAANDWDGGRSPPCATMDEAIKQASSMLQQREQ